MKGVVKVCGCMGQEWEEGAVWHEKQYGFRIQGLGLCNAGKRECMWAALGSKQSISWPAADAEHANNVMRPNARGDGRVGRRQGVAQCRKRCCGVGAGSAAVLNALHTMLAAQAMMPTTPPPMTAKGAGTDSTSVAP